MNHPTPAVTPYELLGGESAIRALVKRFYALMDTLPEAYGVRKLHPRDLSGSEEKLFMFLSGWLGGPQLFVEKFGHPRLRARHPEAHRRARVGSTRSCVVLELEQALPAQLAAQPVLPVHVEPKERSVDRGFPQFG